MAQARRRFQCVRGGAGLVDAAAQCREARGVNLGALLVSRLHVDLRRQASAVCRAR
ncbi:putative leader peptide [Amycolatopsis sp. NPDC051903]|uniref:putative leader peptide n=1 Tax=Amycolatopsis sp. NPDC051903 TaxID=3363936 RepID=UPI0037A54EA7